MATDNKMVHLKTYVYLIFLLGYSDIYTAELPSFIQKYKDAIPNIECNEQDSRSNQAEVIVDYLCKFIPLSKNEIRTEGKECLQNKIATTIEKKQPLSLLLLGFPFKSTNHEKKCLSSHIDLGEYFSMITLYTMINNIKLVYSNANCTIISDGLAYHIDGYDPSYQEILQYHAEMEDLVREFPGLSFVSWKINDEISSYKQLQEKVSNTAIEQSINKIAYDEMSSFVSTEFQCKHWQNVFIAKAKEEFAQQQSTKKEQKPLKEKLQTQEINRIKNQIIAKETGQTVPQLITQGKKFSTLVAQVWPTYRECIRLSVHCDREVIDLNQKIPISLIQGNLGTPWHNAIVIDPKNSEYKLFKDTYKKKDSFENKIVCTFNVQNQQGKRISLQYIKGQTP